MAPLSLYRFLSSALLLAGIALFTGKAWAFAFPINNFSFESPDITPCVTSWTCSSQFNNANSGVYTPTSTQYSAFIPPPGSTSSGFVPDGNQAAFMATGSNNQLLTQDVTLKNFVTGGIYTLTAWVGWRQDSVTGGWGSASLELFNNGVLVAQSGVVMPGSGAEAFIVPTPGTWVLETLTYTAQANVNGTISVGLLGSTNNHVEINWDDVALSKQRVPEPATLLLLAMGFGSLAFARRKRKNLA